MLKKATIWC